MQINYTVKKFILGTFISLLLYTLWSIYKTSSGYLWLLHDNHIGSNQYVAIIFLALMLFLVIYLYKKDFYVWLGAFLFSFLFIIYLLCGTLIFIKVLLFG